MCGSAWKVHLVNAAYFGGCIIGISLFVSLSEHLGKQVYVFTQLLLSETTVFLGMRDGHTTFAFAQWHQGCMQ